MLEKFYFVYVLYSLKDRKLYIAFTADLERRYAEHSNGESKSTAPRRPLKLIFFEGYKNKKDALRREQYFKTTKGRAVLKNMLREFLKEL